MEWPGGAPEALVPGYFPAECDAEHHLKVLSLLTVPKFEDKPDGTQPPVGSVQPGLARGAHAAGAHRARARDHHRHVTTGH